MTGALVLLVIAIVVAGFALWRLELARVYRGKPAPRHARAYGVPCSFEVDP